MVFGLGAGRPVDRDSPLQGGTVYLPGGQYGANVGLPDGPPLLYATSFAAFEGEPVAGIWKLWVYDDDPDGYDGIVRRCSPPVRPILAAHVRPSADGDVPAALCAFATPVPATPQYPATTPLALWRVTQPGSTQPQFYAAGALDVVPGTLDWHADVPLKKGENLISLIQPGASGLPEEFCCLRRTVTEFTYALAEGATGGFFDLDVTVANPGAATAPVTFEFLPESGASIAVSRPAGADGPLQVRVDDVVNAAATSTVVRFDGRRPARGRTDHELERQRIRRPRGRRHQSRDALVVCRGLAGLLPHLRPARQRQHRRRPTSR